MKLFWIILALSLLSCSSPQNSQNSQKTPQVHYIWKSTQPREVIRILQDLQVLTASMVQISFQDHARETCKEWGQEMQFWLPLLKPPFEKAAREKWNDQDLKAFEKAYQEFDAQASRCMVGGEIARQSLMAVHQLAQPILHALER